MLSTRGRHMQNKRNMIIRYDRVVQLRSGARTTVVRQVARSPPLSLSIATPRFGWKATSTTSHTLKKEKDHATR